MPVAVFVRSGVAAVFLKKVEKKFENDLTSVGSMLN